MVRIDLPMPTIRPGDDDFRVCMIDFPQLIEIQLEAEEQGLAARWTSAEALRTQVKPTEVLLQSLMREERKGVVRAYRCLLLHSTMGGESAGGVATIDVLPERFASLERLDRDLDVRQAFVRILSLAVGGISMESKR